MQDTSLELEIRKKLKEKESQAKKRKQKKAVILNETDTCLFKITAIFTEKAYNFFLTHKFPNKKILYVGKLEDTPFDEVENKYWAIGYPPIIPAYGYTPPEGAVRQAWDYLGRPKYIVLYKEFPNDKLWDNCIFISRYLSKGFKSYIY